MLTSPKSTRDTILQQLAAQEELLRRLGGERIAQFPWNPVQWAAMNHKEKRVMIAGANQYSGKTTLNTARQSIHITAKYPKGWTGPKYLTGDHRNIKVAACSKSLDKLRDTVVDKMFGTRENLGSGWIPKELIIEKSIVWSKKSKGLIEYAEVKRVNDSGEQIGLCQFYAFSFDQGWERVSGYTLVDVLISEECPQDFHDEMKQRTNMTNGQVYVDMVPKLGNTPLYKSYNDDKTGTRRLVTITIDMCTHITPEKIEQAKLEESDSPWRETVLYGRPTRGTGTIFTTPESYVIMPQHIEQWPEYYKIIIGIDIPHSTGTLGAAKIVWDPDKERMWVTETLKLTDVPREVQAQRLIDMGGGYGGIPIAWPHDAGRHEGEGMNSGPIVSRLKKLGCNMLPEPAYMIGYDGKKTNRTMDWITQVRDMEASRTIKYSPHASDLIEERRIYAHKKGQVVENQDDHCLDGMGKGIFMLRFAKSVSSTMKHPYRGYQRGGPKPRRRDVNFFDI